MGSPYFRMLAFDPSTDITGVVIVDFDRYGKPSILDAVAVRSIGRHANSLTQRGQRIKHTRECLEAWFAESPFLSGVSAVGYEFHTARNGDTNEAISGATWTYLTIPLIPVVPIYLINPMTAKAAWGGTRYNREQAKPAVVRWARRMFNLTLSDTDDAIADALAVALAAHGLWKKEQIALSQGVLLGKGSRKFSQVKGTAKP